MQDKKKNNLIYIAHGNIDFKNEAICSILSYLLVKKIEDNTKIILYTDDALYFKNLLGDNNQLVYEEINTLQWQKWKGEINFVHRVKIEVIRHALEKYKGTVLYLDSDTFILLDPAPVFEALLEGKRFMHIREGLLATGISLHQNIYKFLKQSLVPEWNSISADVQMFNAGAIGLSSTDSALLSQVLDLTDSLYQAYPSHVIEQFAFSKVIADKGPIEEVAPYVLHYWHMKDIRPVLAEFFTRHAGEPLPVLLEKLRQLPIVEASRQKHVWESHYRWQRGLLRMIGKGWKWPTG